MLHYRSYITFCIKTSTDKIVKLGSCLIRIVEQFENANECFIVNLPTLPGFKGKNGIQNAERYQRLRKALINSSIKVYMLFVIHVAQNFKKFMLSLQRAEPKIHILLDKFKLIIDLALCSVDKSKIYNNKGFLLCNDGLLKVTKAKSQTKSRNKFFFWNIKT